MRYLAFAVSLTLLSSCGYLEKDPNARNFEANWTFETIEAPMKFYSGVQFANSCAEIVNGFFSPLRYSANPNHEVFTNIQFSMTPGGVNETLSGPGAILTYWFFADTMCRNTIESNGGSLLGLNLNRSPSSISTAERNELVTRLMEKAYGYYDSEEASIIYNFMNETTPQFQAMTPGSARALYKQVCVLVLVSVGMNGV